MHLGKLFYYRIRTPTRFCETERTHLWDSLRGWSPYQPVDLRGHDEIALGEAIDLVRPERDFRFAPGQQNIRMVPLLLGQRTHTIHEIERLLKVGKWEGASDVVLVDHAPLRNDFVHRLDLLPFERRHSAAAGDAFFVG